MSYTSYEVTEQDSDTVVAYFLTQNDADSFTALKPDVNYSTREFDGLSFIHR